MVDKILTDRSVSVTELKRDPSHVGRLAEEGPIVVLCKSKPAFYCVSPEDYTAMMEKLDDADLAALAEQRKDQKRVRVNPEEL